MVIAVILAVDMAALAWCLDRGYGSAAISTWNQWRVWAAGCTVLLLVLMYCRTNPFVSYALVYGGLTLLFCPVYYVYRALYEWTFHVADIKDIWAGPWRSIGCVIVFTVISFMHERSLVSS